MDILPPQQQRSYRPEIDGLRAIAVLAVVIFHAFPEYVSGGFVGVDVFFVISGFLISGIIFKGLDRGTFSFKDFYSRRIRRIFPALIVVLATTLFMGWFLLQADQYKVLGKQIGFWAGFLQNFLLWKEAGYFDVASDLKPLLHLWSLAIEEQFYLIFPLLMYYLTRFKWSRTALISAAFMASFVLNIMTYESYPTAAFYNPLSRIWELLLGALLAIYMERKRGGCRYKDDFLAVEYAFFIRPWLDWVEYYNWIKNHAVSRMVCFITYLRRRYLNFCRSG